MSVRIIYLLETIKINEQQCDPGLHAFSRGQRLLQTVLEQRSVRQASEQIVMGEKTHARIHVLALRNIFSYPKNLDGFTIKVEQRVSLGAQPAVIAVAPRHTVFDIQIARAVQALLQRMIKFWAIF